MARTKLDRFSEPKVPVYEQRARILRSAGGRLGYNDREMGELAGMKQSTMSGKIRGKRKWDIDDLDAFDRILHFTDDEIIQFVRAGRKK